MFAYRLALKSGFWVFNPDLMLSLMPQRVFREWIAYTEIEPWDEQRADWRAAMVAHTMYSMWRGKGPRRKLSDFMPKLSKQRTPRTPKDVLRTMARIATLFGGSIQDNRPEWKKQRDGPLVGAGEIAQWKAEAEQQPARTRDRRGRRDKPY